ncbi:MAG: transcription elongation factor GreB [Bdellovibrionales bacterium]|nr:transcription elongation factor GreB [Oligoflexia bacterium]
MSKAFTKEDDAAEDSLDIELQSLPTKKNYMTPRGFTRLRDELHELLNKTRPDLVQVVTWAASNGDRSENADYIYGKRKLREIDRRIRFLTKRLEIAEVIEPGQVKSNKVQFGASVTFQNEEGVQRTISIVGIDESEPGQGKISWISPLAKILLNQETGDEVTFRSPKGEEELEILKIEYREIQ